MFNYGRKLIERYGIVLDWWCSDIKGNVQSFVWPLDFKTWVDEVSSLARCLLTSLCTDIPILRLSRGKDWVGDLSYYANER